MTIEKETMNTKNDTDAGKPGFPTEWLSAVNRDAWRAWLEENHKGQPEIWLRIKKAGSAQSGVYLGEAVEEALCFGWIDSRMYSMDGESFVLRFSPRRPGSPWSLINRNRAEALIADGRMTEAGMAPIREAQSDGRWLRAYTSRR